MPTKLSGLLTLCLVLLGASLEAAQITLRYGGARSAGEHDWHVILQPNSVSAVAVEIGMQFTGGSIVALQPNATVFDDLNPGQNPFTGSVTIGATIHNGGSSAFAAFGGVIPEVAETLVMTVVTNGPGTLSLGGQNHNGIFTGARVWQGANPTDGLTALLQVTGTEADFNLDGVVNGVDFLQWQRGSGISTGAVLANGDANSDGAVNGTDLAIWRGQFGAGAGPGVIAVPETVATSCVLLVGAVFLRLARRKRG